MLHYKNLYTAIVLLFSAALADCNTSMNQSKQKNVHWEGYIYFNVKMFNNIDDRGIPVDPVGETHLLSADRKMYLHRDRLIDIRETKHFVEGKYTMSDTTSYNFYDLTNQKFIYFNKLSVDATILQSGKTTEFTNVPKLDPMNEVPDSTWKVTDTIISGKTIGVVSFTYPDTTDTIGIEIAKRAKFWVDYSVKDFPLQLSYNLSNKLNGGFVYKMQNPAPDGKALLVTTLTYDPKNLPDTLVRIFNKWTQIAKE